MSEMNDLLRRFHSTLVEEIRDNRPEDLHAPFTVAEIYQDLVPYRTHRERLGVEMNADYEEVLLRLLAGEGGYLRMDSEPAVRSIREELERVDPNTGIFREFAAVDVRLDAFYDADDLGRDAPGGSAEEGEERGEDGEEMSLGDALPPDAPGAEAWEPGSVGEEEGWSPPDEAEEAGDSREAASTVATATAEAPEPAADPPGTCQWCREELPVRADLRFCPFCGTDVTLVPCGSCGAEIEPGWRFCVACGTEVDLDEL